MRRERRTMMAAVLVAVLALVMSPGQPLRAEPAPVAALAGVWQLNRDLSTPPGGGLAAGGDDQRNGRGARGMGGGRGGRFGGMRGGRGGAGRVSEDDIARLREAMRELLQAPTRLTIVQHDAAVHFTDDEGRVRKFVADGRTEKHQLEAATLETRTEWKDGALRITWETGRGPKIVRTYRVVTTAGPQLVVDTRIEGGRAGDRPPVKHVYDPITAE